MLKHKKLGYQTEVIPNGSMVSTENGVKAIENLFVNERVLTDDGKWESIISIQGKTAENQFIIQLHGTNDVYLSLDSKVLVREVDFVDGGGQTVPSVGLPKRIPIRQLRVDKHLVLAPNAVINKHNPSSKEVTTQSSYLDQQNNQWVQIKSIGFQAGEYAGRKLGLKRNVGITVGGVAIQ